MTVAAVILTDSPEAATADADGLASVRRIADTAWSGGATPVIVVAADPDGSVAAALAGAPVTLAEPAPAAGGSAAQILRGIEVALAEVRETSGVLVWPASMTWVGPETVTSLLEAHGTDAGRVLTPTYDGERGWPILAPVPSAIDRIRAVSAGAQADAISAELRRTLGGAELDLGDPGTTIDRSTPRSALPPYVGPVEPPAGHVHEWGAELADVPEDAPLEGPALAPYAPAGASEEG